MFSFNPKPAFCPTTSGSTTAALEPPQPKPQDVTQTSKMSVVDDRDEIENETMYWVQEFDAQQDLENEDMFQVLEDVFVAIDAAELAEVEPNFIQVLVGKLVQPMVAEVARLAAEQLRFQKGSHTVCNLGTGEWVSGSIQAVNEPTPVKPWIKIPYVVYLDPPVGKLIAAPVDANDTIRPEVCFGQSSDSLEFTLMCLPAQHKSESRRFSVGERVACLIEDSVPDPQGTVWAAGTINEVDVSMETAAQKLVEGSRMAPREWPLGVTAAPYRVQMDKGFSVLVHKDEHWLVRDLAYQLEGPCDAKGRPHIPLERFQKQQQGDTWVHVDHMTRNVRPGTNE